MSLLGLHWSAQPVNYFGRGPVTQAISPLLARVIAGHTLTLDYSTL